MCGASEPVLEAAGADYLYGTTGQEYRCVRCGVCDHLYLDPRPAISELAKIYPETYTTFAQDFGQTGSAIARLKDRVLLDRFSAAFTTPPRPDMRFLDIGCGDGRFLLSLRERFPHAELSGLDWNFGPGVADELRAHDVTPIVGAIETVDLPEHHFDIISMNQLIEHVWDVRLVLARCRRALKPGGHLAIETPNPDGWDRRLFRAGAWGNYYWPRHLNLFSARHLRALITEAGLAVDYHQSLLAPPCWVYSLQFLARRRGFGGRWVPKVFADTNPALLAVFAVVDRLALMFGATTSQQKLVARKGSLPV